MQNVKEHATLSAGANVDHGVEVESRKGHENRAADRGCVSRLVRFSSLLTSADTTNERQRDYECPSKNPTRTNDRSKDRHLLKMIVHIVSCEEIDQKARPRNKKKVIRAQTVDREPRDNAIT